MIDNPLIWTPVMDFYELEKSYVLNAEIPGVDRKDIKIELSGSELTVRGTRRMDAVCSNEKYHRLEGHRGKFLRRFPLPAPADESQMQIKLEDGILNVVLPKLIANKPQRSNR